MEQGFERRDNGLLVPNHKLLVGGKYHVEHLRGGEVIDAFDCDNLVTNEGLNSLLNVYLQAATQITTWYLGVFEGNYTPVATDTAATFVASATESTAYTATARQAWTPATASGQSITNSANKASFTFNATKTIYGAFLSSASAQSATTGVLFSAAKFSAAKSVVANDQLLLTYTFSATSA